MTQRNQARKACVAQSVQISSDIGCARFAGSFLSLTRPGVPLRSPQALCRRRARGLIKRARSSDALSRVPIPKWNADSRFRCAFERGKGCGNDLVRVGARDCIRSQRNCDRSLGVFAQRKTGNAQDAGLFLNAAGIGQHQPRAAIQTQEIKVAEGIDQS